MLYASSGNREQERMKQKNMRDKEREWKKRKGRQSQTIELHDDDDAYSILCENSE